MKIKVGVLLTTLLLLLVTGRAQEQTPLIANVPGRNTLALNGRWQTIIDPYETGITTIVISRVPRATSKMPNQKA